MKQSNKISKIEDFVNYMEESIKQINEFIEEPDLFYNFASDSDKEVATNEENSNSNAPVYSVKETRKVKTSKGGNEQTGYYRERMIIHRQVSNL